MIYFRSDYSLGAHPAVLDALTKTNAEHTDGYGMDPHCENAAALIKDWIGVSDCDVHFMVGGTPCNITVIAAALRPYESVLAARTGHAYFHETGGVEATGHRVVTVKDKDGKLTPAAIDEALQESTDEHQPHLKMVYISQPTEIGTVYTKAEMTALAAACRAHDLFLYVDGARLPMALTSKDCDLTIRDLAALTDAFYIGGTKCGALFGEALVLKEPHIRDHFRWMIKRQGGLLAKGRLLGVQFEALLAGGANSVYLLAAAHTNEMAELFRKGFRELGVPCLGSSTTNQLFPVLPVPVVRALEKDFFFYEWEPEKEGNITLRLVTSFGTTSEEVDAFLSRLKELLSTPGAAATASGATAGTSDAAAADTTRFHYRGVAVSSLSGDKSLVTERIIDRILADSDIPLSEETIENETDYIFRGTLHRIKYASMFGEGTAQDTPDETALLAKIRAQVIRDLKEEALIKYILKEEQFTVTPEELLQEATQMAKRQNTDLTMLRRFFGDDFSGLTTDVMKRKAYDLLYDTATEEMRCVSPP